MSWVVAWRNGATSEKSYAVLADGSYHWERSCSNGLFEATRFPSKEHAAAFRRNLRSGLRDRVELEEID